MKPSDTQDQSGQSQIFYYATIALVVGFHFVFVAFFAANFPVADDYSNLLLSTIAFANATTPGETIELLLQHHTMHITAFNRAVAFSYYSVFGELDFRHLIFIGNGLLMLLVLLLIKTVGDIPDKKLIVTVLVLILAHPASGITSLWAITSLSNYGVWIFGCSAICLAWRLPDSFFGFLLVVFLCLASALTLGNGMLALPICLLIYLYRKKNGWEKLAVIAAGAFVTVYILDLLSPNNTAILAMRRISMEYFLTHPWHAISHTASFFGSYLSRAQSAATFFGLLGAAYIAIRLWRSRYSGPSLHLSLLVFVAISITAASASRISMQSTTEGSEIARYYFYSNLFWAMLFLDFVHSTPAIIGRVWRYRTISISVFFAIALLVTHYYSSFRLAEERLNVQKVLFDKYVLMEDSSDKSGLNLILGAVSDNLIKAQAQGVYDASLVIDSIELEEKIDVSECHRTVKITDSSESIYITRKRLDYLFSVEIDHKKVPGESVKKIMFCSGGVGFEADLSYRDVVILDNFLSSPGQIKLAFLLRYEGDISDIDSVILISHRGNIADLKVNIR